MLKSVLLIKESFSKYFGLYLPKKGKDEYLYKHDSLTAQEYELLETVAYILDSFKQTTKALEYEESSLTDALIAIDYCLELFENAKNINRDNPLLVEMMNSG
jgi:hypothetical protein